MFNGRYELLRRVARGGMADVFVARDASLSRQVAVKVLSPEFANDPSFVERFRREAKAAANLNHPNIVGIYDWGQEQGTYYIVMEYVVGRNMVEVLRSTGRLSPDRAAEIAVEVAEALNSAHNAGLVHRDIKLGNIIVSDEGQVKVADFGIATALARAAGDNLTHIGSVMGTATYFSPEQAQGKALDGRSDLYSLGVVLYEMVVGAPPFAAETATAVAVKHVQERPPAPSAQGVTIPESLEAIILKLLAKNPAKRYPRADDLCADLRQYLSGAHRITKSEAPSARQPPAAPPQEPSRPAIAPGAPTDAAGDPYAAATPYPSGARHANPAGGHPAGPSQPTPPSPPPPSGQAPPPPSPPGQPPPPPSPSGQPPPHYPEPPAYYYEAVHPSGGWKRGILMFLGLVVLLGALGFLGVAFYRALGLDDEEDPVVGGASEPVDELIDVPDLSGLSYGEADARLRAAGLLAAPSYQINTAVAENTVFAQSPPAGQRVADGATVALTVSRGENPVVPPVRGRNSIDATNILRNSGYEVIVITGASQAEAGIVVAQEPSSNTELAQGEAVTITVSSGPGQIFVPDVRGMTLGEAFQALVDKGFRVGDRSEPSATVPAGQIIDTDPPNGSPVSNGLEVFVIVSDGPPLIAIPDVQGLLFDTGKLAIERSGLLVGVVTFEAVEPGATEVGRILAQTPAPNLEVASGTQVDVVVGEPSAVEEPPPDQQPDSGPPPDQQPDPGQQSDSGQQPEQQSDPDPDPQPETPPPDAESETEGLDQGDADRIDGSETPA